jgi:hypothetical protein
MNYVVDQQLVLLVVMEEEVSSIRKNLFHLEIYLSKKRRPTCKSDL